jgi:hypothetical protein
MDEQRESSEGFAVLLSWLGFGLLVATVVGLTLFYGRADMTTAENTTSPAVTTQQ